MSKMNKEKEIRLQKTYRQWIDSFMEDIPLRNFKELLSDQIMGFGTTTEEKVFGADEVLRLLKIGREQGKSLADKKYEEKLVQRQNFVGADIAILIEEIDVSYKIRGNEVKLPLRISTVLVYQNEGWKITHWHGSMGVKSDNDTWHQDEWKRENKRLQEKVEERTAELKKSLADLKATQAQLVQSEKMASLGELTAGIAHEIQNPLNFVNNFSEVSYELIDEMNDELGKGAIEEAKAIAADIKQNLEKINHHGKRADGIVKGMLQHSRSSTGKKEPTDINKLAEEYLRLAYHGLRAKDQSFNATLETDFDKAIESIAVAPQDIGRVILNLLTNAFYAVKEKSSSSKASKSITYTPTVSVSTERKGEAVHIIVSDNGNGIPMKVMNKIFQPFFTTKPSGKGTGLGLSMSYDIITKGHGGELNVETKEGVGTTFTIILPTEIK